MMYHALKILAQETSLVQEGGAAAPRTPVMKFSDLQDGLRQVHSGAADSHTFFYGFLILLGVVLGIMLLAKAWEAWHLGEVLAQLGEILCHPFSGLMAGGEAVIAPKATASYPAKFSVMCPNLKCRCILIVPEEARGANVRCSACKRLVRIPPHVPAFHNPLHARAPFVSRQVRALERRLRMGHG